jgi:hypothetical protein
LPDASSSEAPTARNGAGSRWRCLFTVKPSSRNRRPISSSAVSSQTSIPTLAHQQKSGQGYRAKPVVGTKGDLAILIGDALQAENVGQKRALALGSLTARRT